MRSARLVGVLIIIAGIAGAIGVTTAANGASATDPPGEFFAVSCVGPTYCLAVGTAVASWNGDQWKLLPKPKSPKGTLEVFMNAVSCPQINNCVVVGSFQSSSTRKTLAEQWNGHQWTATGVGSAKNADLEAVSCPTISWCMVGGGIYSVAGGFFTGPIAGTWDGTGGSDWTPTRIPPAAGGSRASLGTLTCASATACVATGNGIDTWNGQSWSNVPTSPYEINDASCQPGDSVAACQYLGVFASGGKYYSDTLQNTGSSWQLVGAASGSTPITGNPAAYSCATSMSCFAVGERTVHATGDELTFTEHWNGENWKQVGSPSPNPAHKGLQYDAFFGLSCISADNCTAVGRANSDLLVEQWNGVRWQVGHFG